VGDIDLKMISDPENSNKFQKTRFWKEESVEEVITLGPTALATLVPMMAQICFKSDLQYSFKCVWAILITVHLNFYKEETLLSFRLAPRALPSIHGTLKVTNISVSPHT
jgi:hypothetical protein